MRRASLTSEAVPAPPGKATTSTEVRQPGEQQVNKAATAAGEQLSGNPLLGPGQITTTPGCDHQ